VTKQARQSVSIIIAGSGGSGVMTAGKMLLDSAAQAGRYGLMTRSYGPQIRGGEAMTTIRLSSRPVECVGDRDDVLVALDWRNIERFLPEVALSQDSLIIGDPKAGVIPESIQAINADQRDIPLAQIAKKIPGGRPNMVALGVLAALTGIPVESVVATAERGLKKRGRDVVEAGLAGLRAGMDAATELSGLDIPASTAGAGGERWSITGNEAAACGAVHGGIRYAAGYPITPATEILEWLATALPKVGGKLVQAEDELASVAQIIGASFGGVPALTATSGPGLALMVESIGLAVAAEVPIVVVDVMRGGPSTGIPTKSEQTDLNIAIHGLHGDAPHLVLAALSVADCLLTTQWAVHLAEALQTPAIVLSDQFLGQTRAIIDRPASVDYIAKRRIAGPINGEYNRYALTDSGVSPMAIPGLAGGQYTAEGLAHTERGVPSAAALNHVAQLRKRHGKLENYDYGAHWAEIEGEGDAAIITWGSTTGPIREALARMTDWQSKIRLIAIRLLSPSRPEHLAAALEGVHRVLVIEQSQTGQFHDYLRAKYDLPGEVKTFCQSGAVTIRPGTILNEIAGWSA
jgi:2-oxoglutarate ferredoxin oxidoreductase subunit alpha